MASLRPQPVCSIQRHLAPAGTGLTPATFDALIAPAQHLQRAQGRSFMRPWRTNLLALAGLLAASVAGAQEATPSPSPAPADDASKPVGFREEVVVTETRPGSTRVTLRGVNPGGVASTIGIYFDDVPFGSSTGLANGSISAGDFDTFDVARVEVLRGPQGTLYGASSLGGVLKFVPNRPRNDRFEARLLGSAETVDNGDPGYSLTGMANVPLGAK